MPAARECTLLRQGCCMPAAQNANQRRRGQMRPTKALCCSVQHKKQLLELLLDDHRSTRAVHYGGAGAATGLEQSMLFTQSVQTRLQR
jgi:hypothetical protein